MRILALTSWWPEPADNGIKLRLSRLLQSLAGGHELHLATLCQAAASGSPGLLRLGRGRAGPRGAG